MNSFFPDLETPIINILYGWSEICVQFGFLLVPDAYVSIEHLTEFFYHHLNLKQSS